MSQQNLNKIYSQVKQVETLVSSSVEVDSEVDWGGPGSGAYRINKYDSGKTLYLDNDNGAEMFMLTLPTEPSDDMLGWNIRAIIKDSGGGVLVGVPPTGDLFTLTGSMVAGGTGWNDAPLGVADGILGVAAGAAVDIVCVEADSENLKFVFTTKS